MKLTFVQLQEILFIIVLYKNKLSDSLTYRSLNNYSEKMGLSLQIMIYDNTPYHQKYENDSNNKIIYIRDASNPGVARAYNKGLEYCNKKIIPWMLLMDQDTEFNGDFLSNTVLSLKNHGENKDTVCFIPKITSKSGEILSPMILKRGGLVRPVKVAKSGIQKNNITGLNSGTLLRVSYLNKLGGFNEQFGLDMLDHWLFREIHKSGCSVYLTKAEMQHDLSVMDFEKNMTLERYKDLLLSERHFMEGNLAEIVIYKLRLFVRIFKQLRYKEKQFLLLSLKAILK
jgi:GT2 family glycosyltransferase